MKNAFAASCFAFTILTLLVFACGENKAPAPNLALSQDELASILEAFQADSSGELAYSFRGKLPPEFMQTDLKVMKLALEEAQTGIYRYSPKEKVDSAFTAAYLMAADSLPYLDFIRLIARIQNVIACGHSGWGHPQAYFAFRNQEMRFFPLDLLVREGRFFVRRNGSTEPAITDLAEILSLNGQSPAEISHKLRQHMVRDGNSGPRRSLDIENFFRMAYSNFIANPDSFKLVLRNFGSGAETKWTLPALSLARIDSLTRERYPQDPGLGIPLRIEFLDSLQSAIYTIKWFRNEYIAARGQDFVSFTDSVFAQLEQRKVQNLIIDLRGNKGGWTANGLHLFSYLIAHEMPYVKRVEVRKARDLSFAPLVNIEAGYLDTFELKRNGKGLLEWTNYPSLHVNPAPEHGFSGQVYVLIDDMSRSCSAAFSAMTQAHTRAIFVGEETGATRCGSNAMVMGMQLPRTRIQLNFSTAVYHYNVPDSADGGGIEPDWEVSYLFRDFQEGKDGQMNFVLKRIAAAQEASQK